MCDAVVRVIDCCSERGLPYFFKDFVRSDTLRQLRYAFEPLNNLRVAMSFSIYAASVRPCRQMLVALGAVLEKGALHAAARKIDPAVLLQSRLYPDMLPLVRQVQIATDGAKAGGARLAGVATPSYPDTESSFDEVRARIDQTIAFLDGLDAAQIDEAGSRIISFTVAKRPRRMTVTDYVTAWMLPNFYFHVTMAFAILRHNGVEVGKVDFLGDVPELAG
jgi:hypothetical protein